MGPDIPRLAILGGSPDHHPRDRSAVSSPAGPSLIAFDPRLCAIGKRQIRGAHKLRGLRPLGSRLRIIAFGFEKFIMEIIAPGRRPMSGYEESKEHADRARRRET